MPLTGVAYPEEETLTTIGSRRHCLSSRMRFALMGLGLERRCVLGLLQIDGRRTTSTVMPSMKMLPAVFIRPGPV